MKGSLRQLVLVGAVVAAAAGVGGAGASPSATAQPAVAAKPCKAGFRHAVIGGRHRCLRAGQSCRRRLDRQYHRAGFHCHGRRLTRPRRANPPPPPSPPAVRELRSGPLAAGTYETRVFLPRARFTVGAGWFSTVGADGFELIRREGDSGLNLGVTNFFRRSSIAQAIAAMSSVPGLSATAASPTSVAGASGQRFVVTVTASREVNLFEEPGRFGWVLHPGDAARIDVIDVRGETIVIIVEAPANELASFSALADEVLRTLTFPS